jgi:hypothetical protein
MPATARCRAPHLAVLAGALFLAITPTVRAADPAPADTALGKVPADVESFGSMLRLGETVETIGQSRAWKQLWNAPEVKALREKAKAAFDADNEKTAPFKAFFAEPANAEIPALALDALSNEIFISVGAGTGDLLSLVQELAGGVRFGPAFQKLLGENPGDPTKARIRILLQGLTEKPERIRIPDMLIGFKLTDPAKVAAQLKRVDPLLTLALADTPLKGRAKRVKVDGDDFLVLELDGSLVPWDDLPIAMYEEKEGEFAPLLKHLKGMKLTISVGVRQGYLLIGIGSTTAQLAKFGGPGPKLAGRPEFKPLAEFAGKPLTAIGYTSATLRQAVATTPEDVLAFSELIKAGLEQADLPDNIREGIEKDAKTLLQSIARSLPKPGAATSFSFRTPRGWETYAHDYSTPSPEPSRPLTLLDHVGGDPLLAAVWRSGTTVDDYRGLVKWIKVIAGHVEKVAAVKAPGSEEILKTARTEIYPILNELSDVTERLWLPALADGQEGFVLDAKWTSRQWHVAAPKTDRSLPLPELGIVVGVSDRAKLEKSLESYRTVANKLLAKARELAPPDTIPEFEIPKPKVETRDGRTFAYYPIPQELGLDKQVQPTGGLSDTVAVLTLSRAHADRLLTKTPFQAGLAPFANRSRPADSVFYLNWTGIVDAAAPWVDYAIRTKAPEDDREHAEQIAKKVIAALKLFRGYGSVTYREGGATVTHSEAVFQDIPTGGK